MKYMERPNKKDYLTTNQFDYQESLNKYYELLEMYIDVLENRLTNVINYTNCCMELKNGDCSCLIKYPNLGVDELKDCKKGFDYFNNKNKI